MQLCGVREQRSGFMVAPGMTCNLSDHIKNFVEPAAHHSGTLRHGFDEYMTRREPTKSSEFGDFGMKANKPFYHNAVSGCSWTAFRHALYKLCQDRNSPLALYTSDFSPRPPQLLLPLLHSSIVCRCATRRLTMIVIVPFRWHVQLMTGRDKLETAIRTPETRPSYISIRMRSVCRTLEEFESRNR